jgi:putative FmdB family regulatory protein
MVEKIMPVYEYACPTCRNIFEEWLKFSETTESMPCPKCGSRAQRIISNTAFVLKGGGWYVTDYGYRKNASEDGTSPASSATDAPEHNANSASAATAPSQPASGTANGAPA